MVNFATLRQTGAAMAMMSDLLIHIEKKIHSLHEPALIENLQLRLASHEFICLVGQNGCGKTTLLNCIAGLESFTGSIHLEHKKQQPHIGYVFQQPRLLPWRTVRENIELVLNPTELVEKKNFIDELLDIMQLTAHQHHYPKALSGGMARCVSIIRAFIINPDILLMDEPFVALDAPKAREVRFLLMDLWQKRPHTVLFVTHDLREAIALADKLIFLAAKPLRIITEVAVPIARNERTDERLVEAFRQDLINNAMIQTLL